MDRNAFQHTRLKIGRARFHIAELEREIAEFMARRPYVCLISERRVGGQFQMQFTTYTREAPPEILPLLLGDVVHNLRVSLDVAANALVALSNYIPKGVYFPFGTDEAHFEAQMKDKMKGASAEAKNLVRALKPYRGGNDTLRALHDLDIVDKHSAPLVCENVVTSPSMTVQGIGTPAGFSLDYSAAGLKPIDQSLFAEPWHPTDGYKLVGMVDDDKVTHTFCFAKKLPLGGEPAIESLYNLAEAIEGIVQTFEAHFFGDQS